ncbi:MAG: hypothetical protein RLZZ535_3614 [Cyanobacteriota bacterium]|jgi:hypothetical protein
MFKTALQLAINLISDSEYTYDVFDHRIGKSTSMKSDRYCHHFAQDHTREYNLMNGNRLNRFNLLSFLIENLIDVSSTLHIEPEIRRSIKIFS